MTVVDLAIERAPQIEPTKASIGGVRIDSPREIAANKVCAILGRTAPRELVDLEALLARGARVEDVVSDARANDRAADAATLAWVLSPYRIAPTAPLPEGVSRDAPESVRASLIARLLPSLRPASQRASSARFRAEIREIVRVPVGPS